MEVASYMSTVYDAEFSPQLGEFSSESKERPEWLDLFSSAHTNWQLVLRNEGFAKISQVLSIALALGLCDASHVDFKIAGMKLFSMGATQKHASALDLADAVFGTIAYFVEGGYACFEANSIRPLLYGDLEADQFDTLYAKCARCSDLARSGNMHQLEDMDDNAYLKMLSDCVEKAKLLKKTSKDNMFSNFMSRKIDQLRAWETTFQQIRLEGGLRQAPYSIGVFGATSVGKSSVANLLMVTTLLSNGHQASDEYIITLNEGDKYMSNMRSYMNGIFIDDIGNTKADFVEKAPTALMIQLVNNVRMYANMAEADQKGKVSVEPKVVITTKNVKDSCATVYSNEPASIARRDRITLTVTVKPEYAYHNMLSETKVAKAFPNGTPIVPDLWNITVERAFPIKNPTKGKSDTVGWEPLQWEGKDMVDVSIMDLMRFIAVDSKKFYQAQEQLVENNSHLDRKLRCCEICRLPVPDVCRCPHNTFVPPPAPVPEESIPEEVEEPDPAMDDQVGELLVATFLPRTYTWYSSMTGIWDRWSTKAEEAGVEILLDRLQKLEDEPWTRWTNYIPSDWLDHEWTKNIIWYTHEAEIRGNVMTAYWRQSYISICILMMSLFIHPIFLILLMVPLAGVCGVIEHEKEMLYSRVVADNEAMDVLFKKLREKHIKWITRSCLALLALYTLAQVYKLVRVQPSDQGNLAPTSEEEIDERDEEANPWAGLVVEQLPATEKARTTKHSDLTKMVSANLCFCKISATVDGKAKTFGCDAFFPKSNVALIPQHMWKAKDMMAEFIRHDTSLIGGNFKCPIYKEQSVDIPDTDLSLVYIPNGGDWKDLSPYFPVTRFDSAPAMLVYKDQKGTVRTDKVRMEPGPQRTAVAQFFGALYKTTFPTYQGLCMATLVTQTSTPFIGGFHLGGRTGHRLGCSGFLDKSALDKAFDLLGQSESVILAKSSGTIPTEQYDVQFFESDDVHYRSPTRYLPKGANCKVYGSVQGRATFRTSVEDTIISDAITQICDVPQQWSGPKFRTTRDWQASLQYSTQPSSGVEGSLLVAASRDYLHGMISEIDKFPKVKQHIRPLTEMETVCGVDGLRFIDAMPVSTAIGYPLKGPKAQYITELEPEDFPSHACPRKLDQRFWDAAYDMAESYARGERAYAIFKASKKDEPTPTTKDKVRVFQCAPIALQLLIRKYFLPVARVFSVFPLVSECAVGINAQGPEWDQLCRYIRQHGIDRILAGDYSKYDLRMPAQLMFAAFRIMIDIAKHCGYDDYALDIMRGIATDVCYPLMAYNGDLIQHFGSNPSGQNLTVYINSIVNSLLFRCAYFHIYKDRENVLPFAEVCALATYGDDAKSSVREDHPEFNHLSLAAFLEERDMKFTMPDKTSVPTAYMSDGDADFLKRSSLYNDKLGVFMGALDEDSIFKSLHSVLHSKALSREEQAMQNIDGALREWFAHGEDVYEMRRHQMQAVATQCELTHGCRMLDVSYEEQLHQWRTKYT